MLARAIESASKSIVYVVDDDKPVLDGLGTLLRSVGLHTELFDTSERFLAFGRPEVPSCLILDVRLQGKSGLSFQQEIARIGLRMPVVFITGYGDVEMSVKAMKAGAMDFLEKPFRDQDMLDAVSNALALDSKRIAHDRTLADVRSSYDSLTRREREVLGLVLGGLMNKQIAAQIGVTEITVKIHRGQVMRKMGVSSVAALALKAASLGIVPALTGATRMRHAI